jgi:hypothetical protein
MRPVLTHHRLLQEWLWFDIASAGVSPGPPPGPPPAPPPSPFASPQPPPPVPIGFAPDDAEFITASADAALVAAHSLGALSTGLLLNTVAAARGTLSTAVAGTHYYAPGGTDIRIADGGTGTSTAPLDGQVLIGGGGNYTPGNISGAPDEIIVASASGSITLSTPQPIATTSTPEFAGLVTTGGVRVAVAAVSIDTPLTSTHHVVLCSKKITLTLPKCTANDVGRVYVAKNVGSQQVTIECTLADKIDGAKSYILLSKRGVTVVSNGSSAWHVIETVF